MKKLNVCKCLKVLTKCINFAAEIEHNVKCITIFSDNQ